MGQAGVFLGVIGAADVGKGQKGRHRCVMSFHDDDLQTVFQGVLRHSLLKLGEVKTEGGRHNQGQEQAG